MYAKKGATAQQQAGAQPFMLVPLESSMNYVTFAMTNRWKSDNDPLCRRKPNGTFALVYLPSQSTHASIM